ncbi:tRNA methyltransferase 11 [Blomia tropicalis]|nr:tRNA methyltransferase 11 [Blomia tropicalis]
MTKKYIIRYANELLNFRLMEFYSLTEHFGLEYCFVENPSDKPYFIIETKEEYRLLNVINRSVLAQELYEYWTSAETWKQFESNLKSSENIHNEFYKSCSFRIIVETFGRKITMKDKVERIERFDFLPFDGQIKLNDPEISFYYFEYFGNDRNIIPDLPYQMLFGKRIADSGRKNVPKFSLKERKFIANTSMEPTLAFLMSNIAKIDANDFVYDPFVGSGSLLVSAAFHGAYICGSDIDYLLLHGLAKPSRCGATNRDHDESILSNLKQYGLESKYIDVISADSSLALLRKFPFFDAIVTDPPYGKRESRERIGTKKNYKIPDELVAEHIPSKLEYNIGDIYRDLMKTAAENLKLGGRILFWAPYSNLKEDEVKPEQINRHEAYLPQTDFFSENDELEKELRSRFNHPNLKFIGFAKQGLAYRYCRILIAMEKVS